MEKRLTTTDDLNILEAKTLSNNDKNGKIYSLKFILISLNLITMNTHSIWVDGRLACKSHL